MATTKPIPVRLSDDVITRLTEAANRMGTNRAALMRFLVKTFADSFDEKGLRALPHDWKQVMRDLDGRTYGQQPQALRAAETHSESSAAKLPRKSVNYADDAKNQKKKTRP